MYLEEQDLEPKYLIKAKTNVPSGYKLDLCLWCEASNGDSPTSNTYSISVELESIDCSSALALNSLSAITESYSTQAEKRVA